MKMVPRKTFALVGGDGTIREVGPRGKLSKPRPCEWIERVVIGPVVKPDTGASK